MENIRRGFRQIDRSARIYTARAVRSTGLSPAELEALRHIAYHGVCNQQELVSDLNVDKAAVARLAAGLEKKGYITREPDPEDGRSKLMRANAIAAQVSDQMISTEADFYAWLLRELPEEELAAFSATLEKLRRRAIEERRCCFCHLRKKEGDSPCT